MNEGDGVMLKNEAQENNVSQEVFYKHFLRLHYREILREGRGLGRLSLAVGQRLLSVPGFRRARRVGIYLSQPLEVDTQGILREDFEWYVPVVFPKTHRLRFSRWTPDTPLVRNVYGIQEPAVRVRRFVSVNFLDFLVVPGSAFTRNGDRLGAGGGYYDRLLAKPHPPVVGLAYDQQLAERLPVSSFDGRVDFVVTPTRIFRSKK